MTAKKKKKGKGLLFAVLILIVLLVLYFVIDLQQKKSDQEAETEETEESSLPVSVTEDEISKVTVKNGDVTMTYVKTTIPGLTRRTRISRWMRVRSIRK